MIGTIKAHGKTYEVIEAKTVSAVRNEGRSNTATAMQKAGIAQSFVVKSLKGDRIYEIQQYENQEFGKPVKVA